MPQLSFTSWKVLVFSSGQVLKTGSSTTAAECGASEQQLVRWDRKVLFFLMSQGEIKVQEIPAVFYQLSRVSFTYANNF